jgi:hypothetical protein
LAIAVALYVAYEVFFGPSTDPVAAVNGEHRAALAAEARGDWFAAIASYERALAKAPGDRIILQGLAKLHTRLDHVLPAALYECAYLETIGRPAAESAARLAAAARALLRLADRLYGEAIQLAKAGSRAAHLATERKKAIPVIESIPGSAAARPCAGLLAAEPVAVPCAHDSRRACGKLDVRNPELIDPELIADTLRALAPTDASTALARLAAKLAAVAAFLNARATTG